MEQQGYALLTFQEAGKPVRNVESPRSLQETRGIWVGSEQDLFLLWLKQESGLHDVSFRHRESRFLSFSFKYLSGALNLSIFSMNNPKKRVNPPTTQITIWRDLSTI